jgi:hypothetical protein
MAIAIRPKQLSREKTAAALAPYATRCASGCGITERKKGLTMPLHINFKLTVESLADAQAEMMAGFLDATENSRLAVEVFGAALGDLMAALHANHRRHIESGCENCKAAGLPDYRQLFFNAFDKQYRSVRDQAEHEDREAIANANHSLDKIFKGHKK